MKRLLPLAALFCVVAVSARAEGPAVTIELNKLEPHDGACRAYLVVENAMEGAFEGLKLDLVMFDVDGIVAKRLAVEAGPLPAGKTSLKVFDIDGLPCERLGRVLLNEVISCLDGSGARDDCLALISTSARSTVAFIE
jgi:hypothetical protein